DRHRGGVDDGPADGVDVAAGGQVHDRVGAEVDGRVQFLQLVVDLAGDGRVADVALILQADATPMAIGSSRFFRWLTLAGMTIRPRATSDRTRSGPRSSRAATNAISGVTVPWRAASSWVMTGLAFLRRRYPDQVRGV